MINIIHTLIVIVISLCVIAVPVGIVLGIVFAVFAGDKNRAAKKTRNIVISIISFVGPIVLLFIILSLWGFLSILTKTQGV